MDDHFLYGHLYHHTGDKLYTINHTGPYGVWRMVRKPGYKRIYKKREKGVTWTNRKLTCQWPVREAATYTPVAFRIMLCF